MSTQIDRAITLDDLKSFALIAGDIAKNHFTHFGMLREQKADRTPVTVADKLINRKFIEFVREIWPEVDIIGEEESSRTKSPWIMITDPIDGTYPYTWGAPVFTNMFAMLSYGESVMGVIHDPIMGRTYSAERGKGAFMNDHRLQVSKQTVDDRPTIGYASWSGSGNKTYDLSGRPVEMQKVAYFLEQNGVSTINFCSIGYLEAAVASGELAGCIFPGVAIHDTVPGDIIVREAGGRVTDLFGNKHDYLLEKIDGHVMSNGVIHDLLLEAVHYATSE